MTNATIQTDENREPSLWAQMPTSTKVLGAGAVLALSALAVQIPSTLRDLREIDRQEALRNAKSRVTERAHALTSAAIGVAVHTADISHLAPTVNLPVSGETAELLPFFAKELGSLANQVLTLSTNGTDFADPSNRQRFVDLTGQLGMNLQDYWEFAGRGVNLQNYTIKGRSTDGSEWVFLATLNQALQGLPAMHEARNNLLTAEELLRNQQRTATP